MAGEGEGVPLGPVVVCQPWVDADRLCCPDATVPVPCDSDDPDAEPQAATYLWTDDELIEAASGILFRATCGLFPGLCTVTVRPCLDCACACWPCGCGRYEFIDLQERYPVVSIEEVLVDGVELDADAYRVDDWHRLVRVDGQRWSRCQRLDRADDQPGTVAVTYVAGRVPPIELQIAAAELACQLKRACGGASCGLPSNVTSVARQGVTMTIEAVEQALKAGGVGIAMIDSAVRQYNCARAKSRVWHPNLRQARGVHPS